MAYEDEHNSLTRRFGTVEGGDQSYTYVTAIYRLYL